MIDYAYSGEKQWSRERGEGVWGGEKVCLLNRCLGKISPRESYLKIVLHYLEDRPCKFAESVIFDLKSCHRKRRPSLCLLSIGNCHRASSGRRVKVKIRSPTGRTLNTENVWQAQTQTQEVRKHRYYNCRDMTCSKSDASVATGKEQTGRIIQVQSEVISKISK